MPTITDQAVCVRHWDFSETSQTVSLFAREHGLIRGLAKGSRREKGNFSGGIDLLTRGELVAIVKPSRELANLTAWHLEEIFWSLRRSLPANRLGMYMADLVNRMVSAHDPHPALWDAFVVALRGLGGDGEGTLLTFQVALLAETGYRPELDRDAETGGPLPDDGETLAFSPRHGGNKIKLIAAGKTASGFDMLAKLAVGADMVNSARTMMMALGCIQSRTCNTNHCPTGIATQDPARNSALDVEKKHRRVKNYHQATVESCMDLVGAMGMDNPDKLAATHILQRVDDKTARHFDEIFDHLQADELLSSRPHETVTLS